MSPDTRWRRCSHMQMHHSVYWQSVEVGDCQAGGAAWGGAHHPVFFLSGLSFDYGSESAAGASSAHAELRKVRLELLPDIREHRVVLAAPELIGIGLHVV